ncbi:MAG TPA: hypothetical protein PKC40_08645, partial [Saprospiraceae bacterium]|nr:hypothetical protein [Saprospiraceae bacterium]
MVNIPITPLIRQIEIIREKMIAEEWSSSAMLNDLEPHYRDSARNLLHYLILRSFDLRDLQENLSSLGISSIG